MPRHNFGRSARLPVLRLSNSFKLSTAKGKKATTKQWDGYSRKVKREVKKMGVIYEHVLNGKDDLLKAALKHMETGDGKTPVMPA